MAPRTRRAVALKNSPASNGVSSTSSTRATRSSAAQKVATNPLKRPGRPPKVSYTAATESISSATTPATTISDSEYSTPATSNAVTPAPSIPAQAASGTSATRLTRSRLVVELPERPPDMDVDTVQPKGFSRTKRIRRARNSFVEDSEGDDDLDVDNDASIALARRLQDEEDHKAALSLIAESSSKASRQESTKNARSSLPFDPSLSASDDEFLCTPLRNSRKEKGKGKAKSMAQPTTVKRPSTVIRDSDNDDDDDEPLSYPKSSRKKRKVDDADDDDATISPPDDIYEEVARTSDGDESVQLAIDTGISLSDSSDFSDAVVQPRRPGRGNSSLRGLSRAEKERIRLEHHHPELMTMWRDLEEMPVLKAGKAEQPKSINRILKPFQLEGLAWMKAMEKIEWKGGLLGDEMGLGKTIQAVSLIMSDYPAKLPSLVLVPPVALMQWTTEIASYTDGKLKTLVFHGTNSKAKNMTVKQLKTFDVILMSYNSLESLYRKQEKGFQRKDGLFKEKSAIHQIKFHRVILDEAHCIKVRPKPRLVSASTDKST